MKGVTNKPTSYRLGTKLTQAQKLQKQNQKLKNQVQKLKDKAKTTRGRSGKITNAFNSGSEGVGKYVSRTQKKGKPLTRRQVYKLEQQSLRNEGMAINARPEMIKASGIALAENLAGPSTSLGTGVVMREYNNAQNNSKLDNLTKQINNLTNGGVNQSGTDNEEEIKDNLPGGANIR